MVRIRKVDWIYCQGVDESIVIVLLVKRIDSMNFNRIIMIGRLKLIRFIFAYFGFIFASTST